MLRFVFLLALVTVGEKVNLICVSSISSCVQVEEHHAVDIDVYHCPNCDVVHGPSLSE